MYLVRQTMRFSSWQSCSVSFSHRRPKRALDCNNYCLFDRKIYFKMKFTCLFDCVYCFSRWSFSLNFLPVRGLKFSGGLLIKNRNLRVSLAARYFCVVFADNRSPHKWENIERK